MAQALQEAFNRRDLELYRPNPANTNALQTAKQLILKLDKSQPQLLATREPVVRDHFSVLHALPKRGYEASHFTPVKLNLDPGATNNMIGGPYRKPLRIEDVDLHIGNNFISTKFSSYCADYVRGGCKRRP